MNALQDAITKARGAAKLARICGQHPQAVTRWKRTGRVPEHHCATIEAATGVRCEELRPDVVWTRNAAGTVTGYHVPLRVDAQGAAAYAQAS